MGRTKNIKKRLLAAVVIIAMLTSPFASFAAEQNGAGTAVTAAELGIPIHTAAELDAVRNNLAGQYYLANDIDLSSHGNWNPIGDRSAAFTGTFDGNGHRITNVTIPSLTGRYYTGLFANVGNGGVVENLSVSVNISAITFSSSLFGAYTCVGAIAGYNAGTIQRCRAEGKVNSAATGGTGTQNTIQTGGLVGLNGGTIRQSCYEGNVDATVGYGGTTNVGGLVGNNSSGIIEDCYETAAVYGNVTGALSVIRIGGLIGNNGGTVRRCYATGSVSLPVANSYSIGDLIGTGSDVVSCYYQDSGDPWGGRGIPLSAAQMKTQASFVDWDFGSVWAISPTVNDGYPYLRGVYSGGDGGGSGGEDPDGYKVFSATVSPSTGGMVGDEFTFVVRTSRTVSRLFMYAENGELADEWFGINNYVVDPAADQLIWTVHRKISTPGDRTLKFCAGDVNGANTDSYTTVNFHVMKDLRVFDATVSPNPGAKESTFTFTVRTTIDTSKLLIRDAANNSLVENWDSEDYIDEANERVWTLTRIIHDVGNRVFNFYASDGIDINENEEGYKTVGFEVREKVYAMYGGVLMSQKKENRSYDDDSYLHPSDINWDTPAVDISVDEGTALYAISSGWVTYSQRFNGFESNKKYTSYGIFAKLEYEYKDEEGKINTNTVLYAHLSDFGPLAKEHRIFVSNGIRDNEPIKIEQGQIIGYSGNTGKSGGPHLHFSIITRNNEGKVVWRARHYSDYKDYLEAIK